MGRNILFRTIIVGVKTIAREKRDWAQLLIQQEQVGIYSQGAGMGKGCQWMENY